MVKVSAKKEDSNMTTIETLPIEESNLPDDPLILQKLTNEETKLLEEKQKLEVIKENLQKKTKEEIEIRKNNILKLKTEITDLKVACETLTKTLNMCVQAQLTKE
jgi:predicted RNase H-like nuclease (RuvC/YqgF family)